ncbi:MAG: SGNH/GDSL hydrolase family protein [Pseudomonadota bacterium]
MNRRVLIIGDSMALPRKGVPYNATWPYKLACRFKDVEFVNRSILGSTAARLNIGDAADESGCIEAYRPQIIILQLGIVDCAPRLFKRSSIVPKLMRYLPHGIQSRFVDFVKTYRGRRAEFSYLSPVEFRDHIEQFIRRSADFNVRKIFAVKIGPISNDVSKSSPQFDDQISIYNEILNEVSNANSCFSLIEAGFDASLADRHTVDGYHLNEKGHNSLFLAIESPLEKELTIAV